jgi:hypothetical protein
VLGSANLAEKLAYPFWGYSSAGAGKPLVRPFVTSDQLEIVVDLLFDRLPKMLARCGTVVRCHDH